MGSVETPIKVSHVLRTEVFFSVHGEDVKGDPLPDGGPGELRVMYVNKSVVLPAVSDPFCRLTKLIAVLPDPRSLEPSHLYAITLLTTASTNTQTKQMTIAHGCLRPTARHVPCAKPTRPTSSAANVRPQPSLTRVTITRQSS